MERNAERTRTNILQAAIKEFSEKGYAGADLDFEYIDGTNRDAYSSFVGQAAGFSST